MYLELVAFSFNGGLIDGNDGNSGIGEGAVGEDTVVEVKRRRGYAIANDIIVMVSFGRVGDENVLWMEKARNYVNLRVYVIALWRIDDGIILSACSRLFRASFHRLSTKSRPCA